MSLLLCQSGKTPLAAILAERILPNLDEDTHFAVLKGLLKEMLAEAKRPGLPISILLDDRRVRYFMVTPPLDALSAKDCQSAIALRFKSLYGESMDAWQVAADWDAREPFLVCALPKALFVVLQETAAEHRLTLTQVLPCFIAHLNRWRKEIREGEWFATVLARHLTLGITDKTTPGRLTAIRSTDLSEADLQNRTWLTEYATREAMRMNRPEPSKIKVCGEVPESWLGTTTGKILCTRLDREIGTPGGLGMRSMNAGIALARCGLWR